MTQNNYIIINEQSKKYTNYFLLPIGLIPSKHLNKTFVFLIKFSIWHTVVVLVLRPLYYMGFKMVYTLKNVKSANRHDPRLLFFKQILWKRW